MKKLRLFFSVTSLCSTVAALILAVLPGGVAMRFMSSPSEATTYTFSYFSDMPLGYGNWFPMLTGILTATLVVFCVMEWTRIGRFKQFQIAGLVVSVLAFFCSVLTFLFGSFTAIGAVIAALAAINAAARTGAFIIFHKNQIG